MNVDRKNLNMTALATAALLLTFLASFYGCKKEEPMKMSQQTAVAAASDANGATEQKLCPVTGEPINKNVYTVYKGKKVYFCCEMCKPQFEKDPAKYIGKLPQFAK